MINSAKNVITGPPVIVVMGHVDHGKTSILDYIRKTNISQKENRRHHATYRRFTNRIQRQTNYIY